MKLIRIFSVTKNKNIMKSKRKVVSLALVVALIAILVASGSLAYFTGQDSEVNVFTVGDVSIDVVETDKDGNPFEDNQVIIPHRDIEKVAKVQNTGTDAAYIRAVVALDSDLAGMLDFSFPNAGGSPDHWTKQTYVDEASNVTYYYFDLGGTLAAGAESLPFLNQVTMKDDVTRDGKSGLLTYTEGNNHYEYTQDGTFGVTVFAYAVQALGQKSFDGAMTGAGFVPENFPTTYAKIHAAA